MDARTNFSETAAIQYFDACRSQFGNGLALINALVAGAERMRKAQVDAAQQVRAKQSEIVTQVANASSIQDLLALQGTLMSEYCRGAVAYWARLAELAQQTQAEIGALVQKQGSDALSRVSASTGAPQSTSGASGSLVTVMQTAFDAARGANEAFVKALTGAYPPAAATKKPAKAAAARSPTG
jgi:phasin family protein